MMAVSLTSASTILSGFAIFFVAGLIPCAIWFHHRVIRPLSFVLGLKADESPTGEAIPPIPTQLADMRRTQLTIQATQKATENRLVRIEGELHPNGGTSLRDAVDDKQRRIVALDLKVVDLANRLETLHQEDATERAAVAALAAKTAAELAEFTAKAS